MALGDVFCGVFTNKFGQYKSSQRSPNPDSVAHLVETVAGHVYILMHANIESTRRQSVDHATFPMRVHLSVLEVGLLPHLVVFVVYASTVECFGGVCSDLVW